VGPEARLDQRGVLALLPMVRWASCPPCGRLSEGWWSMRGLEAHATKNPSQR
jgi:hypothetical protein